MSRITKLEKEIDELAKLIEQKSNGKKKKLKVPFKVKSNFRKANKDPQQVVVLYLTQKYEAKWKLCKIISGDLVVVANKVHQLNPKVMWRYGKNRLYILREIDRKPVSNSDYNKVIARKDDTEADVPLIKAVLGAVQKQKGLAANKGIIIWIIIAVIAAVALFTFFGGG